MNKIADLRIRDEIVNNKKFTDFYILSLYSKEILNLDNLRIKDYKDFYNKIKEENEDFCQKFKLKKYCINTLFSFTLMFYFKSLLVVPLFFSSIYLVRKVYYGISNRYLIKEHICHSCYFCQRNFCKQNTKEKFSKYYTLIKYVLTNNSQINNINDFEKELDDLINIHRLEYR